MDIARPQLISDLVTLWPNMHGVHSWVLQLEIHDILSVKHSNGWFETDQIILIGCGLKLRGLALSLNHAWTTIK